MAKRGRKPGGGKYGEPTSTMRVPKQAKEKVEELLKNMSEVDKLTEDEVTLHLIATGIHKLYQDFEKDGRLTAPYPAPLQRGYNRLIARCIERQVDYPNSAIDLIRWANDRSLTEWPLELGKKVAKGQKLLNGGNPTDICDEWSLQVADVESELCQKSLYEKLRSRCDPSFYTSVRDFIIRHPVAIEIDLLDITQNFNEVSQIFHDIYEQIPQIHTVNNNFLKCKFCGHLVIKNIRGELVCTNYNCEFKGMSNQTVEISRNQGVRRVIYGIKKYVTIPGVLEIQLADFLKKLGIDVELWPGKDNYDLRFTLNNKIIAVDVKDSGNPFALAKRETKLPEKIPTWDEFYFVLADRGKTYYPDFKDIFINLCSLPQEDYQFMFASEFQNFVKESLL